MSQRAHAQHNEHKVPSPTHPIPQNLRLAGPIQQCVTICPSVQLAMSKGHTSEGRRLGGAFHNLWF